MTFTGHRLYRGVGGIANVDYDTLIAEVVGGVAAIQADTHAASTRYTYVLRPVVDDVETPVISCSCELVTDSGGDWIGARPAAPVILGATVLAAGVVRLTWRYKTPAGQTAPASFGVYYAQAPSITAGSPNTTQAYTADTRYHKSLTLADGVTYWFAVTAISAAAVESALSDIIGPFVADATAPPAITAYVTAGS